MKVESRFLAEGFSVSKRKRHSPEQIVRKLRDAGAMLAGEPAARVAGRLLVLPAAAD